MRRFIIKRGPMIKFIFTKYTFIVAEKGWGCYFRICGYGLTCQRQDRFPPDFSERNGYVKYYYFWKYKFRPLKRSEITSLIKAVKDISQEISSTYIDKNWSIK